MAEVLGSGEAIVALHPNYPSSEHNWKLNISVIELPKITLDQYNSQMPSYDGPIGAGKNLLAVVGTTMAHYLHSGALTPYHNICMGDFGSGLYANYNNKLVVAGITSFIANFGDNKYGNAKGLSFAVTLCIIWSLL
ncbi:hypothetical protein BX661DRAFT_171254 [Kickxella alabastrina]|uniref:uncharacterized protein n=1 Tax=Kickxella alabastrina TaxID=61397 RepID=UPI00221FE533|nr:uncharacterized protein BX661DRAFT_171254 [Kickxella alabastrina]KAI7827319.1 hypothetical protein BX661DRAFT_171254 [Kickxella alabastrina]